MFKSSIGIILYLFSFSLYAIVNCGAGKSEKRYSSLNWRTVGHYEVETAVLTLKGVICAGISSDFSKLERVHYRDSLGKEIEHAAEHFMQKDVPMIEKTSFPRVAWMFLRNEPILTLRTKELISDGTEKRYLSTMKFLRKFTKGGPTDIRELELTYVIDTTNLKAYSLRDAQEINNIKLEIKGLDEVERILILKDTKVYFSLSPWDLPQVKKHQLEFYFASLM